LRAAIASITKQRPATTISETSTKPDSSSDLDGSCGYSYERDRLSFQKIDYPPWDMYFCHKIEYRFPLIDHLCDAFNRHAEFDCTLFMERTRQMWGTSWLYRAGE
jgi:hypothetical protein